MGMKCFWSFFSVNGSRKKTEDFTGEVKEVKKWFALCQLLEQPIRSDGGGNLPAFTLSLLKIPVACKKLEEFSAMMEKKDYCEKV